MTPDLWRGILLVAGWVVLSIGIDLVLRAAVPGMDSRMASLWIVLAMAGLVAAGVTRARWWRAVGYGPWREPRWLLVPVLLTLFPLLAGIRPLDPGTYALLVAGYALTGFAEETMFRGVLVKLFERRRPIAIAGLTALLFGLVHLSNIVIRGEVAIIVAQAVGAAAFGFGYAALRLRTRALPALAGLHALTDLFLQMGNLPLIPVAVVQDVILFAFGLWLLHQGRRSISGKGDSPFCGSDMR